MNKRRAVAISLAAVGLATSSILAREFVILRVSSESMQPSLCMGDFVLVHRIRSTPEAALLRNEVVIFVRGEGVLVTKRIAGLEGDHVEFSPGFLRLNNLPPVAFDRCPGRATAPDNVVTHRQFDVAKGYAFMLGDNYGLAEDSRHYGSVPLSAVVGSVVARIPTTASACPCGYQMGEAH